jgi:putative endonuclease
LPAKAGNPVIIGQAMSTERYFWVYILASRLGGTLYIGVTNDLVRRVYEHRTDAIPGFTSKHGVHRLVYYEQFFDIENAIRREKRLKKWTRAWKIQLIEKTNPNWDDLYPSIAIP